jgi:carboxypeptidase D
LIGNGWISGPQQYISYIPFAYEAGIIRSGDEVDTIARNQERVCLEELQKDPENTHIDLKVCEQIMQLIMSHTSKNGDCVNMYDVRLRDSYPSCGMSWPPDLEYVTPYLRRNDVLAALHVNRREKFTGWVECNNQVGGAFTARNSLPSVHLLPELLEHMRILLFHGDKDMICNHIGGENVVNNLKWNGAVGMEISTGMTAPKQEWTFEGEPAGSYQTARNLTYLRFYNSSHMVPFDYPRRTRDMLDRFMGVDIAVIGGKPADSRVDGEKSLETSVGGHTNSTAAQEEAAERLQEASWAAYRRSGEVALVIVLIAAGAWGFFIIRERKKRKGYTGVLALDPYDENNRSMSDGLGLNGSARKMQRDVEAARDFDEAELDDLSPSGRKERGVDGGDAFGLADDEDDDEEDERIHGRANGRG